MWGGACAKAVDGWEEAALHLRLVRDDGLHKMEHRHQCHCRKQNAFEFLSRAPQSGMAQRAAQSCLLTTEVNK